MGMPSAVLSIPQARLVRKGGHHFTPPPRPRDRAPGVLRTQLRDVVAVAVGMWPLTGIVLLGLGLLWIAGTNGAP